LNPDSVRWVPHVYAGFRKTSDAFLGRFCARWVAPVECDAYDGLADVVVN